MLELDVLIAGSGILALRNAQDGFEQKAPQKLDVSSQPDSTKLVVGIVKTVSRRVGSVYVADLILSHAE